MKVSDEDMEKAVLFLAGSDEEFARSKAYYNALERQTKVIKAMQFMRSPEKTGAAKEQAALVSPPYQEHLNKVSQAEQEFLILQEQRNTSITMIEVWRSLNSARSKGVV